MDIRIDASYDGKTIKTFLLSGLGLSQKFLRSVKFREDGILLDGERVTVRRVLHTGDLLSVAIDEEISEKTPPAPVDLPLDILYEDEDLVVPAKPARMPTHPSHDHYHDTVANALAYRYRDEEKPFVFRPINRLDRNTSGVLLVAKNRLAASRLSRALKEGRFCKKYLAVLDGCVPNDGGLLEDYLHRSAKSIIVREVTSKDAPDAEYAKTVYRVLFRTSDHTLVAAQPLTGRTHQLRVQFSHMGFPISGDDLYGRASDSISRQALHAFSLTFPHPKTDLPITFIAPPPADFAGFAKAVFGENLSFDFLSTEDIL